MFLWASVKKQSPLLSLVRSTARKREKIEEALELAAGLRVEATADRSEIVPGEGFTVRVEARHREGISGDFKKPALRLRRAAAMIEAMVTPSGTLCRMTAPKITVPSQLEIMKPEALCGLM